MNDKLTESMADVIKRVTNLTPVEISNMSAEELEKHNKVMRRKNRLFSHILNIRIPSKRKIELTEIEPRGSRIAAHHRYVFRQETNKMIKRLR